MFDPTLNYPYQDMPVWIPMAILAYLKETADFSILEEQVGYYDDERKESIYFDRTARRYRHHRHSGSNSAPGSQQRP